MKRMYWMGIATALLGAAVVLPAQEKALTMGHLPAAVQAAVKAELAKGATLRGLSTEVENGRREYEAELTVKGARRDIAMDAAGTMLETEDQVTLASLPTAARAALQRQGKVLSVESVTEHGRFTAFEAVVRKTNGKRTEVRVDRNGNSVADNG